MKNISLLCILFLLVVVIQPLRGQVNREGVEKPNIEKNVRHRLKQLGLSSNVKIFSISDKGDYLYALPILVNGKDILWDDFHTNKKVWTKNPIFWGRLFKTRRSESWRSLRKSSLHITVHYFHDKTRYYEMHLDNWAPKGIRDPVNSVRHIFGEVLWHKITGRSVNQDRIRRGLVKIDEDSRRIP
jgi:hypothetical protein